MFANCINIENKNILFYIRFFRERIQADIEYRKQVEQDHEAMKKRIEDLERKMNNYKQGLYNISHILPFDLFQRNYRQHSY